MPGDSTGKHMTFAVNSFELSVCYTVPYVQARRFVQV